MLDQRDLHSSVSQALTRYYLLKDRSPALVIPIEFVNELIPPPTWVPPMLEQTVPHDDDYYVFKAFTNSKEVILDVGANWGYSAGSVWSVGSSCKVVSLEALSIHSECLAQIAFMRKGQFDYKIVGLADFHASLKFVIPVINGRAISGLASGLREPDVGVLTKNICNHVLRWGLSGQVTLQLLELTANVQRLDTVLNENPGLVGSRRICAIKLDVEGYEYSVLRGARETLHRNRPLVMLEAGARWPNLREWMFTLGYVFVGREHLLCLPANTRTTGCNEFYVHRALITAYMHTGILDGV